MEQPDYSSHCLTLLSGVQSEIQQSLKRGHAFTVLMNVPLKKLGKMERGEGKFGYLVDVSGGNNPVDGILAAQCPHSGESGKLFSNSTFHSLRVVNVSRINRAVQTQYWKANEDIRTASNLLVAREALKYGFSSSETEVPESGKRICQLPLSPHRYDCPNVMANPILGVVYRFADTPHLSDTEKNQLGTVAKDAGGRVFTKLVQFFYGANYHSIFGEFYRAINSYSKLDIVHIVIATFLLSHHWFYAFRPIALKALLLLRENDNAAVGEIYTRFNFHFPECSIEKCPDGIEHCVQYLSTDLLGLLLCALPNDSLNDADIHSRIFERIRCEIWRVLLLLTGKRVELDQNRSPIVTTSQPSYVTLSSRSQALASLAHPKCVVPVFDIEQIEGIGRRGTELESKKSKFHQSIAPRFSSLDSFYAKREAKEQDWTFRGIHVSPKESFSPRRWAWPTGGAPGFEHHDNTEPMKDWENMRWLKIGFVFGILADIPKEAKAQASTQ